MSLELAVAFWFGLAAGLLAAVILGASILGPVWSRDGRRVWWLNHKAKLLERKAVARTRFLKARKSLEELERHEGEGGHS